MKNFEYAQPKSIIEVYEYLDEENSLVKAGGIDLLDLMKEGIINPRRLVNIREIESLNYVKEKENGMVGVGPTITISELAENEIIQSDFPVLATAASLIATPQIRNTATLGGNLCQKPRCWYYRSIDFNCLRKGGEVCFAQNGENKYHAILGNDGECIIVQPSATAVALMALNARLIISDGKSTRKSSIEDFYINPKEDFTRENILMDGELIIEIELPSEVRKLKSAYIKLKEKDSFDWPLADVAVTMEMSGGICNKANVILGSAAPTPWRSTPAENTLLGKTINKEVAKKAASEAMKGAIPLEQNKYKIKVFTTIIYRTICEAAGINPYT